MTMLTRTTMSTTMTMTTLTMTLARTIPSLESTAPGVKIAKRVLRSIQCDRTGTAVMRQVGVPEIVVGSACAA